jgi:hypothetical protein
MPEFPPSKSAHGVCAIPQDTLPRRAQISAERHALPTHRCQGCGEYLFARELPDHCRTEWGNDGTPYPVPCGPIDELHPRSQGASEPASVVPPCAEPLRRPFGPRVVVYGTADLVSSSGFPVPERVRIKAPAPPWPHTPSATAVYRDGARVEFLCLADLESALGLNLNGLSPEGS